MKIDTKKILMIIAEKEMTYETVCRRAGITQMELRFIRAGKRNPRPATIGKIAKALNVSVEDIIKEGDM